MQSFNHCNSFIEIQFTYNTSHTLRCEIRHFLEYLQNAAISPQSILEALHNSPQRNTLLISRQPLFLLTPKA